MARPKLPDSEKKQNATFRLSRQMIEFIKSHENYTAWLESIINRSWSEELEISKKVKNQK